MGAFLFGSMALVALTLLALLRPWQDRRAEHEASVREINAGVYRDQLAELDRDLATGSIAPAEHAVAREELQRRLLEDVSTGDKPATHEASSRRALLGIAIALPLAASGLYAWLGQPAALLAPSAATTAAAGHGGPTAAEIEQMVAALAARLEKNPDDPKGWSMLARSYHAMGRFPEASAAYARIGPDLHKDPGLLAGYADALASNANGNLEGEPSRLVAEALRLDPDHPTALALAAMAAYKRHDVDQAARHWQHLLRLLPPGSEDARWVANALNEIGVAPDNVAAAGPAATPSSPAAPVRSARADAPAPPDASADARAVAGVVTLAPALKAQVRPDDTVFVFARPTDGSRMPLAVQRARAADLPLTFRLDDSLAMTPQARISNAKEVRVEALVSRRGVANAAPGDLIGSVGPIMPGNTRVALTIDTIRP
jgi:cytochrome c-type biogenesis protein CcmH